MKVTRVEDWRAPWSPAPRWACVVRYGGFGDVIQASSVLPALARQGYQVAFNGDEQGLDLLRHNPHIDRFYVQKRGQVPDEELEGYWGRMDEAFPRFVQLSGSIEGTLLSHPGRPDYYRDTWHQRHARMNKNYLEHTHELAGVPFEPDARFYPSSKERAWARTERRRLAKGAPVILVCLSGSSVHKLYPYWDEVLAAVLRAHETAIIVTVGDILCQAYEHGWERSRRIKRRSGRWNIRRTLAFADQASVVVGTETGVLNAVGLTAVPKVLILSHSSVENLSKHWQNCHNIVPYEARCHPCHKLHFHSSTCSRDPNGGRGAWCAHSVKPGEVVRPILEVIR